MMETTRGLGQLAKQGIRPKRTLFFLSWDGEETSFAGSAEWSEQFEHELGQKAVAYLNVDVGVSGPDFEGNSVGSLAPVLVEASKAVRDPSGRSLYEAWHEARARAFKERDETDVPTDYNLVETRIGSGSDYAALLDHAGVPVLDVSFGGPYGVYHSAYDDFYWMEHFGDPGFRYHAVLAQLLGVVALRLANADVLPFDFASYGAHIRDYLGALGKDSDLSKLDVGSLNAAIDAFELSGKGLNASVQSALSSGTVDPLAADQLNRGMMAVERNWLIPGGLPGSSVVPARLVRLPPDVRAPGVARTDRGGRTRRCAGGATPGHDPRGRLGYQCRSSASAGS